MPAAGHRAGKTNRSIQRRSIPGAPTRSAVTSEAPDDVSGPGTGVARRPGLRECGPAGFRGAPCETQRDAA